MVWHSESVDTGVPREKLFKNDLLWSCQHLLTIAFVHKFEPLFLIRGPVFCTGYKI